MTAAANARMRSHMPEAASVRIFRINFAENAYIGVTNNISSVTKEGSTMACFLAPMILAVITSIIQKMSRGLAERLKLWILNALLWGGAMLLAIEHAWHGEIVPWPPFLTAMSNPANIPVMLHEIATIGTVMSIAAASTWIAILAINRYMERAMALKSVKRIEEPPFSVQAA